MAAQRGGQEKVCRETRYRSCEIRPNSLGTEGNLSRVSQMSFAHFKTGQQGYDDWVTRLSMPAKK